MSWKKRPKPEPERADIDCPLCARPMFKRAGKFGEFYGCSAFPECRGIVNVAEASSGRVDVARVAERAHASAQAAESASHAERQRRAIENRQVDRDLYSWRRQMIASDPSDVAPWVAVDENVDAEFREIFRNA